MGTLRTIIVMLFILVFDTRHCLFSQTPTTLVHAGDAMELEVAENKNGVMVAGVMGATPNNMTLYRSTDAGVTWDSVFFYQGDANFLASPDPVVVADTAGTFYVVVMRTAPAGNPTQFKAHLWVFKSSDDGLTWTQPSKPYTGNNKADYPQILIDKANNRLYLTHSVYQYPTNSSSWIQFTYSANGATTWASPTSFTAQYVSGSYFGAMGPDIGLVLGNKLALSFGDYNLGQIYFTTSSDLGLTWAPKQTLPVAASASLSITKIITHPNFNHLGIISHRPHKAVAQVYYTGSTDGGATWQTQTLAPSASLGEGVIDNTGNVHTIYNHDSSGIFKLNYRFSSNLGVNFSAPVTLFSAPSYTSPTTEGEYQSIFIGNDGLIHITFIDWNDGCKAKHLIMAPLLTSLSEISEAANAPLVFPNPAKDKLTMEFTSQDLAGRFEISDLNGKIVLQGDLQNSTESLSVAPLTPGAYLIKLIRGDQTYIQKIIKE